MQLIFRNVDTCMNTFWVKNAYASVISKLKRNVKSITWYEITHTCADIWKMHGYCLC